MVRPSILKIGMFGWKKQCKAVPGAKDFLQYADQNGVQIYYISDRTTSQVDDTIKNLEKEGHSCSRTWPPHVLRRWRQIKRRPSPKLCRKDQSCLAFGDNLVDFADFSKTSEADRDKEIGRNCKKNLVKNSSSSQIQCMDHGNLLSTKVKN